MSRRTETDDARDLLADLNNRGFRICENVEGGDYLNGYREWSPIDDRRATAVIEQLLVTLPRRKTNG